jgi:hypothetical protein
VITFIAVVVVVVVASAVAAAKPRNCHDDHDNDDDDTLQTVRVCCSFNLIRSAMNAERCSAQHRLWAVAWCTLTSPLSWS